MGLFFLTILLGETLVDYVSKDNFGAFKAPALIDSSYEIKK